MKPVVVFPVPMDNEEVRMTFTPFVTRFSESFTKYPGDCEVVGIICNPNNLHESSLNNPMSSVTIYNGGGCDIGCAQWLSNQLDPDRLMIMMTTRCYFHTDGWLERYLYAHNADPEALLGASASWEGGKRHICTRAYAMKAGLFAAYPHMIDTREKGQKFEVGEWCITDWFAENKRHTLQVTFDGVQEQPDWRKPDNIFRKGDQSNCLVHDRHTDLYRDADAEEKLRLEREVAPK